MANTTKVTKAQRFADIIAMVNGEATVHGTTADVAVEFLNHEIELLARKNTSDKKPTAQQEKNTGIKADILDILSNDPDRLFSASEILKALNDPDLSLPRISALLKQMVEANTVERTTEKRKTFFSLAK